jgi:hypothetical protein
MNAHIVIFGAHGHRDRRDDLHPAAATGAGAGGLIPFGVRWERHQNSFDIAAGFQAKGGATVIDEIKLCIEAAIQQLRLALGVAPVFGHILTNELGVNIRWYQGNNTESGRHVHCGTRRAPADCEPRRVGLRAAASYGSPMIEYCLKRYKIMMLFQ